ncbi:Hypothetical predicted protein [Paramuricea clavata]|uniref:Uncharacterized protein n=1 Tax=Paramuricea clavata TaxID=317549 RepID=A0A6S7FND0_PARCT|nr:Hypothetical predicted protein [Paramuricea clavata]
MCTWRYGIGCIQPAPKTTKAPVTQPSKTSGHITTGPGVKITGRPHKKPTLISSLFTNTALIFQLLGNLCLPGSGWLLDDIIYCGKKNKVRLPKPNLRKVFPKIVVKIQIVERPLGHCGYVKYKKGKVIRVSRKYGRHTIRCLKRHTMVTSISGKKDRVMHSGVVVETKDNKKYLIHKGKWSKTEVKKTKIEVAKDSMFNKYTKIGRNFKPKKPRSVRDYYDESGNGYNFINDNCHDGTLRMVNLAKKS